MNVIDLIKKACSYRLVRASIVWLKVLLLVAAYNILVDPLPVVGLLYAGVLWFTTYWTLAFGFGDGRPKEHIFYGSFLYTFLTAAFFLGTVGYRSDPYSWVILFCTIWAADFAAVITLKHYTDETASDEV
jgi:CDP-diglyceride synthetase